jgi:putative flippase GtrA
MLVATIGAAINAAIMYAGVSLLEFHYLLAQIIATGIVLGWNFLLNKTWTFSG